MNETYIVIPILALVTLYAFLQWRVRQKRKRAIEFLKAHPDEYVWVINWYGTGIGVTFDDDNQKWLAGSTLADDVESTILNAESRLYWVTDYRWGN